MPKSLGWTWGCWWHWLLCVLLWLSKAENVLCCPSENSDYTTGGEPRCDLVHTNEVLKRPYVCVVLRLHSPRMCVWSTLCVLRVVLFTIFSRDLVSHISSSQTLHPWSTQKHQRLALKNSQFPALHHVLFSYGICLFFQPLTCWWSLSNMDNKTTDCAA